MSSSALLLWIADHWPRVAAFIVRVWARFFADPHNPHWLLPVLKRRLNIRVRRRVRLLSGHEMYVDPFDMVGERIAAKGYFEPETVGLVRQLLKPGMVACDVGAHVGQYTVLFSQSVGADGRVHAFEPDTATFATLGANVALNRLQNVTCNQFALADSAGTKTLFLANVGNTGANSLRQTVSFGGEQLTVTCKTLDDYCEEQNLQRLDLVKIDVEGAELLVLRGGAQAIASWRPHLLLEVSALTHCFGYSPADLVRLLAGWGYELFLINDTGLQPLVLPRPADAVENVIAVQRAHVETVDALRSALAP